MTNNTFWNDQDPSSTQPPDDDPAGGRDDADAVDATTADAESSGYEAPSGDVPPHASAAQPLPDAQSSAGTLGQPAGGYQAPDGQPGAAPYGQPSYGEPAGGYQAPYSQPGVAPYGQPGAAPYGQPGAAPYGQPGAAPYGQPGAAPYGQPGAAPYGQPGASGQASFDPYGQAPVGGYGVPSPYGAGNVPVGYGGQLPLATMGKRALGWLVDWFVPLIVLTSILNAILPGSDDLTSNWPGLIAFVIVATGLGYLTKNGQTPGRKIAKTQLVDGFGVPVEGNKAIIRNLTHFVDDLICGVGWLFPLWDKKRQTLADKINNTTVIDLTPNGGNPISGPNQL